MKLRTLAKILGGLIALIIVLLLAAPLFISADYLKGQLVAQVKNATGRTLIIKGKTSLALFPTIAVSAQDVTLGNPEGFAGAYFVHIDKLSTGAALKPLLSKQLSITGITIEGMDLKMEQNAAGARNWDFASSKPAAGADAVKPSADKGSAKATSPLKGFTLGDVSLKNSAVSMTKPGAKPMALSAINLTIRGADGSTPLTLDGSATYLGEAAKLHITLDTMHAFLAGNPSAIEAAVELPAGKVGFKGKVAMKDQVTADGALNVDINDLPKLLAWATGKPAGAGLPKHVEVKGGLFVQNPQAIALTDTTFTADDLSATGKLAVNLAGAVPSVTGTLKIATLNLDTLPGSKPAATAASANAGSAAPASSGQEGWSTAPLDLSGLRAANANLGLTVDTLISGTLQVKAMALNLALTNGVAKLTLTNAMLYGGTAKGTVTLDGSGADAGLGTNLTLAGIQIEPLMTAVSGTSRLAGTATLTLNLNGHGGSQRALVSTLGGNGGMRVADGAIKGINIAAFLRSAKQGFILADTTSEKTDFTELAMTFTMAQGILSSNDLSMKSPILRLAGSGTVSLPPKNINYRLVPTLVGSLQGQGAKEGATGIEVPLIITGPWSRPSVTLDIVGMLKDPAKLKEGIKNIGTSLKDYNSPKDIGRALMGGGKTATPAADASAPAATTAPAAVPATDGAPKKKHGLGGLLDTLEKSQ